jgi:transcriptional regulator with XRE-family HTH domain
MKDRVRPPEEWYRRMLLSISEDEEHLIGPLFNPVEDKQNTPPGPGTLAFGTLLRLERRNDRMTVAELAKKLDIDEDEIRKIEHDPYYRARPRTISSIAAYFDLPAREIMKLAGVAASNDRHFGEKAMRFAAHSDDMGTLSKEEKELLKSFVEFLKNKK